MRRGDSCSNTRDTPPGESVASDMQNTEVISDHILRRVVVQCGSVREIAHVVFPLGIVVGAAGILHTGAVFPIHAGREELIRSWVYPASVE